MPDKRGTSRRAASRRSAPEAKPAVPAASKWIWWRRDPQGRSPAREEFDALDAQAVGQLLNLIERIKNGDARGKDVSSLGQGLLELRTRAGNNPYRVLFMRWGAHYVALTAFYKNQQKTPPKDINRAAERSRTWRSLYGDRPT